MDIDFDSSPFVYCPETGIITRNDRRGKCGGLHPQGYLLISKNYKHVLAHRLAWYLYYGKWPTNCIDHINGIRSDNRIVNLSEASVRLNSQNLSCHRNGRLCGYYARKSGKFEARIRYENKKYYLGVYKTIAEANNAYSQALELINAGMKPK